MIDLHLHTTASEALLERARAKVGTAIGRPWLARALVRAGHAVATSGGSDFHGFGDTRAALGLVVLPPPELEALEARVPGRAAGRPS